MEAIVLAGGLGTRLRSSVSDLPNCLAPIVSSGVAEGCHFKTVACGDPSRSLRDHPYPLTRPRVATGFEMTPSSTPTDSVPFLFFLLEELARQGVDRVILSVGYMQEKVMEYVNGREWPFEVAWAVEEEPLGTGGGIRLALGMAREERVLVLNGDTFFHVELADLLAVEAPVAIALKPMRDFDRYGAVEVLSSCPANAGRLTVTAFREKKPCAEGLINGGVYALERTLFEGLDLPSKFSFEEAVLVPFAQAGKVAGTVCDGYFIDIGIPADYERAQQELPELRNVLRVATEVLATDADTLFLDRDGVINRYIPNDYVTSLNKFVILPGIPEVMAAWAKRFRRIILVTNQRGIARGRFTRETLDEIHRHMLDVIEAAGGRIDAIYVSTAIPEDDPSRKPQPGMFLEACRDFPEIRADRSVMVGDADSDEAFARNCGMAFVRA